MNRMEVKRSRGAEGEKRGGFEGEAFNLIVHQPSSWINIIVHAVTSSKSAISSQQSIHEPLFQHICLDPWGSPGESLGSW